MLVVYDRNRGLAPACARVASRSLFGLAVTLCASPVYAIITANVSVDTGNVRATMSQLGLGVHTSPYYNQMSNPNVDERLEEAGVTTLRFGGGGYADVYHWSITRAGNGVAGSGLSPWWGQPGNFGYVGAGSDFASFVRLLDQLDGGQAVVTVNYGSAMKLVGGQSAVPDYGGQPEEAAAWVAYANADQNVYGTANDITIGVDQQGNDWKTAGYWAKLRASTASEYQAWATADGVYNPLNSFLAVDRDAPVGIQYWEIGNETFGTNFYGTNPSDTGYSVNYDLAYGTDRRGHPTLSAAQYGQEVVEYSQLMKSIDPSIKIGAVLSTPPDDWGWDYYPKTPGSINNPDNHWNPQVLAQAAQHIDFVMVHWYPWPGPAGNNFGDTLVAFPRDKIPTMIDGSGTHSLANAGLRDWLTTYGIPDAEIMITEFRYFNPENIDPAYRAAADAIFVADSYASWLERGVTSVQFLEMLTDKNFLTDNSTLTRGSSFYAVSMIDRFVEPGDEFVLADSSNNIVRAHAAMQADGSVAVMLLNLHRTDTADVTINISDVYLGSAGTMYTLTGGTTMSAPTPVSGLGNMFVASVAPRSIAVYIIPPALLGDFNEDGAVDAADYVFWRKSDRTPEQYADWRGNFGATLDSDSASAHAPSPSAVPEPSSTLLTIGLCATIGLAKLRQTLRAGQ